MTENELILRLRPNGHYQRLMRPSARSVHLRHVHTSTTKIDLAISDFTAMRFAPPTTNASIDVIMIY